MKIQNEAQLLSEELRKEIIKKEIYSDENRERKAQMLRRHEILKSKSKKWIMFGIEQEGFKPETVEQMRSRASNISLAKKIVNKLSQTYNGGVERRVGKPMQVEGKTVANPSQVSLDSLYDLLDFNTAMKKTDRFRTGFRNCLTGIVPVLDSFESKAMAKKVYNLKMQVLAPWKYDVIEDPADPTKPLAVIISEFPERLRFVQFDGSTQSQGAQGIRAGMGLRTFLADGVDETIADAAEDKEQKESDRRFIWWTDGYHFTTDIKGRIIQELSPEGGINPIQRLPWETFATDQDGSYWADGADDIFETDLLVNKKLTDANFIQFIQGWGQLVIDAVNPPKKLQGGPDNAFIFERTPGEQPATVFFATSNPPIENWLETVRMTLALCLSTNDLSTRSVAAKLDVQNAASGVVLMVENSELSPDIKDNQEYFRDKEPCLLEIANAWHTKYAQEGWLTKEFAEVEPLKETDLSIKFHEIKPPISEKETLEVLQMRKDLGIASIVDLLKRDNPDLTDEEARAKAEEIYNEKKQMASLVTDQAKKGQEQGLKNGNQAADQQQQDNNNPDLSQDNNNNKAAGE